MHYRTAHMMCSYHDYTQHRNYTDKSIHSHCNDALFSQWAISLLQTNTFTAHDIHYILIADTTK